MSRGVCAPRHPTLSYVQIVLSSSNPFKYMSDLSSQDGGTEVKTSSQRAERGDERKSLEAQHIWVYLR